MNMKKIILEELIKDKNKKQQKNIGCSKKISNMLFSLAFVILVSMIALVVLKNGTSEKIMLFYGKCIVFLILLKVFLNVIKNFFVKCFQKDINVGNVKVFVEKAKLVNKYEETEYSYLPNTERKKLKCYLVFQTENRKYVLEVGYGAYKKMENEKEYFLIKVNDKFYSDMIFGTSEYELDDSAKSAVGKEIIIKIL